MTIEILKFGAGSEHHDQGGITDPVAFLGGKGAHLREMASMGIPVPPGMTIPTKHCVEYMASKSQANMVHEASNVACETLKWLEEVTGYMPLVSVRSGAPVSMPGMMDTILNVGLHDGNLAEWAGRIGPKAAVDSYRRLMQMLGCTAMGIKHELFEAPLTAMKQKCGVKEDKELPIEAMAAVVDSYRDVWVQNAKQEFPQNPSIQIRMAIEAVWKSWGNERAMVYRNMHGIAHDMGTAVTIQAMVFGNLNEDSGSGVMFSRNPMTGDRDYVGEFLPCAQGEDVVAGIRTPLPISEMEKRWPQVTSELFELADKLELHYKDMQDIEFTVQDKKLFLLQTRSAKRSAMAAMTIAIDMYDEKLIDETLMKKRITGKQFLTARRPSIAPNVKNKKLVKGLPACPGVAIGCVATSSKQAVILAAQGYKVLLVTHETTPDDIEGMKAAQGILTKTGGATSHAAVVARAMDKPCVVGCETLEFSAGAVIVAGKAYTGTKSQLSIDGLSGQVYDGAVEMISGADSPAMMRLESMVFDLDKSIVRSGGRLVKTPTHVFGYVVAAEWVEAPATGMAKFLESLQGCEKLTKQVFLDLKKPMAHAEHDDARLTGIMGGAELVRKDTVWGNEIGKALLANKELLKGVALVNVGAIGEQLKATLEKAGIVLTGEAPKHATIEEAAFRVFS